MFVPYYPDVIQRAEELNIEILESKTYRCT